MGASTKSLRRLLGVAVAAAASACAGLRGVDRQVVYARTAALPPAIAAAVVGGALRAELRCADPAPQHAGAPVSLHNVEHYLLVYARGPAGAWRPRATHRVAIAPPSGSGPLTVRCEPWTSDELLATGRTGHLRVRIAPDAAGCRIDSSLPAELAARLVRRIDAAIALASSLDAVAPGLEDPNLAAIRLHQLLTAANGANSDDDLRQLLQRATRLPGAPPTVHARLGQLLLAHGDHDEARGALRHAFLASSDPVQRAALAAQLTRCAELAQQPVRLRGAAARQLAAGGLEAAGRLLHSARREVPAPAADYRLLRLLHERRGDDTGALAAALLAHEHRRGDPALAWGTRVENWLASSAKQLRHAAPALATLLVRPAALAQATLGPLH